MASYTVEALAWCTWWVIMCGIFLRCMWLLGDEVEEYLFGRMIDDGKDVEK